MTIKCPLEKNNISVLFLKDTFGGSLLVCIIMLIMMILHIQMLSDSFLTAWVLSRMYFHIIIWLGNQVYSALKMLYCICKSTIALFYTSVDFKLFILYILVHIITFICLCAFNVVQIHSWETVNKDSLYWVWHLLLSVS